MPAMKGRQHCNYCLNVAGAARSYGVIALNLMAVTQSVPRLHTIS
jgi:hypothetical protein